MGSPEEKDKGAERKKARRNSVFLCDWRGRLPCHTTTMRMGTLHKDEYQNNILMVLKETRVTASMF
jgi:hypothetical protein